MTHLFKKSFFHAFVACLYLFPSFAQKQGTGRIEGLVTLSINGKPLHDAAVMLVEVDRIVETDQNGRYVFEEVPSGTYDIVAYTLSLRSASQLVDVREGETTELDFQLEISPLKHDVTVTATGEEEANFEAVQSVLTLDIFDLAEKMAPSIGEVLEGETGVAKRSFGPGSARPVIRGFDGDRVLVMRDGVQTGSLGSQSGDHGEPIDPSDVERLEVVKGPATLLYGSNAVGGVVNAVTGHNELHRQAHKGIRGTVSSSAGTNGGQAGANINAEFGTGRWLFWGGGGGQRIGDYDSPAGSVDNSKSRTTNASTGLGFFGDRFFASFGYRLNDGRYGIPFANTLHGQEHTEEGGEEEELLAVDVDSLQHSFRFSSGWRNLDSILEGFRFTLNYSDWQHEELEFFEGGEEEIGTSFTNKQLVYRGVFEQAQRRRLTGSFGFWGLIRDYDVSGEEALSPPVDKDAFALFGVEELQLKRVKLQFGARIEHTTFTPKGPGVRGHGHEEDEEEEIGELPERDFTGFSGGLGARFDLWQGGAFVSNFTSSHRSPALEELYNFGPHVGNLAFEIGNPDLGGERINGIDFSLRHQDERIHAEANFFLYDINDFVFLAATGEIEDGLFEGEYRQGDARFLGTEVGLDVGVHSNLWLNFGLDAVDAELTQTNSPLPRIPPLRGRIGVDLRYGGFSLKPELVVATRQDETFFNETATAGYSVVNLRASYTLPTQHFLHHFSLNVFNLGDRLYRNHVSFIKDLAPEMGRGVRFSYALKFF